MGLIVLPLAGCTLCLTGLLAAVCACVYCLTRHVTSKSPAAQYAPVVFVTIAWASLYYLFLFAQSAAKFHVYAKLKEKEVSPLPHEPACLAGPEETLGKGRTRGDNRTGQTALTEHSAEHRRRRRKGQKGKNHCGC